MDDPLDARGNPKELLSDVNTASQYVSVQHVAFILVCVYVIIAVFQTKDLDLLLGKNFKLPVIDVDVPIEGFFSIVPYLIIVLHCNLLIYICFLSRKLYRLDASLSQFMEYSDHRDRLYIFPYSYYMIAKLGRVESILVGLLISLTFIFLPLGTLFFIQVKFLAYQDQTVTWVHRVAVWLDVLILLSLWPVIQDPRDEWRSYWRSIFPVPGLRSRMRLVAPVALIGLFMMLWGSSEWTFRLGAGLFLAAPLLVCLMDLFNARLTLRHIGVLLLALCGVFFITVVSGTGEAPVVGLFGFLVCVALALFGSMQGPKGRLAFLVALLLGTPVPLGLLVDGESFEDLAGRLYLTGQTTWLCHRYLDEARHLNLNDTVIAVSPLSPGAQQSLRALEPEELRKTIDPASLRKRSLRRAQLCGATLAFADMRETDLSDAKLTEAKLWETNISYAQAQDADFSRARLEGALFECAHLQGAVLHEADLSGAYLLGAFLQGAVLWKADLHGTDMKRTRLEGVDFGGARLHGANFEEAELMGCRMQGADLRAARVQGSKNNSWLDIRSVNWGLPSRGDVEDDQKRIERVISSKRRQKTVLAWITQVDAKNPQLNLCRIDNPDEAQRWFDLIKPFDEESSEEFTIKLNSILVEQACTAPPIARGLIKQIGSPEDKPPTREGLAKALSERLRSDSWCPGLRGLSLREKEALIALGASAARQGQHGNADETTANADCPGRSHEAKSKP